MDPLKKWAGSGAGAGSGSMQVGRWYHQNAGGDIWFLARSVLKNGGMAGTQVDWKTKTPKGKNSSVPIAFQRLWTATSDVPPEVKEAAG